jgi:hypothetical protein
MELRWYIRWVLVSNTSTGELGQNMSNLQAWLLGLSLHNFFMPSLPSPRTHGLQVAFGTQTIWGPFMLVMSSLGTQKWVGSIPTPSSSSQPCVQPPCH